MTVVVDNSRDQFLDQCHAQFFFFNFVPNYSNRKYKIDKVGIPN